MTACLLACTINLPTDIIATIIAEFYTTQSPFLKVRLHHRSAALQFKYMFACNSSAKRVYFDPHPQRVREL